MYVCVSRSVAKFCQLRVNMLSCNNKWLAYKKFDFIGKRTYLYTNINHEIFIISEIFYLIIRIRKENFINEKNRII